MKNRIGKIKMFRQFMLAQLNELSVEQLNEIPTGFRNNIIWNVGHMICAQQGVCYLRSANQVTVSEKYITPFLTNTKPERTIPSEEIEEIKNHFITTIDRLEADCDKKIFTNYTASPNILRVYKVELKNIEDALEFILYHDGLHSGTIMSLKKLVTINHQNIIL